MSDMIDVDDRHDELQRVGDEAVARTPRTRELSTLAPAELRLRHGLRAAVLRAAKISSSKRTENNRAAARYCDFICERSFRILRR